MHSERSVHRKAKPSIKKAIIRFLKQMFSQYSHLANYLPLMAESTKERVCRLADKSYTSQTEAKEEERTPLNSLFPGLRILNPLEPLMLFWYSLVFLSIMYYYIEMGFVLTFGKPVWENELTTPVWIIVDTITCCILVADILVCLQCGYLYRGMVVMDPKRITNRYYRTYLSTDVAAAVIVILCPATRIFVLNYAKLWLILKLGRLSEMDDYYLRRFNIHRKTKAIYVIFKLMIIIFLLSHVVGLIFYVIDYQLCASGYYEHQCKFVLR